MLNVFFQALLFTPEVNPHFLHIIIPSVCALFNSKLGLSSRAADSSVYWQQYYDRDARGPKAANTSYHTPRTSDPSANWQVG